MFGLPTLLVAFTISAVPASEPDTQSIQNRTIQNRTIQNRIENADQQPVSPANSTGKAPAKLQMLFFSSPNCPMCKKIQPIIDDFIEKKYPIQVVEPHENIDLYIKKYQIREIPTFILLVGDQEIDRYVGGPDRTILQPQLLDMFEKGRQWMRKNGQFRGKEPGKESAKEKGSTIVPAAFRQEIVPKTPQTPAVPQSFPPSWSASSVRIRVDDPKGLSWGTGTIIDTRNNQALILTCGHIFRESKGEGPIEVHLFRENAIVKVFGNCEYYDLHNDIAFILIRPPFPVRAIPLAPTDTLQVGQKLVSLGCDGGAAPSAREHTILSLDRVFFNPPSDQPDLKPFHYIHVSGAPTQGRSGGGLFSGDGFLVGVCNTGDPTSNDGHFVPLSVVREKLDSIGLSFVHQSPSVSDSSQLASAAGPAIDNPPTTLASGPNVPPAGAPEHSTVSFNNSPPPGDVSRGVPSRNDAGKSAITLAAENTPDSLTPEEAATLEEIRRRRAEGAEVILIVQPFRNGNEPPRSEIIKLSGVSQQFIDALTRE